MITGQARLRSSKAIFTKRHYAAVADSIRREASRVRIVGHSDPINRESQLEELRNVVRVLGDTFLNDNPNFQRSAFYNATELFQ